MILAAGHQKRAPKVSDVLRITRLLESMGGISGESPKKRDWDPERNNDLV